MNYMLITIILTLSLACDAQTSYEFTSLQSRTKHDKHLVDSIINGNFRQPLTVANERKWSSAFWAMELMLYKTLLTTQKLQQAWRQATDMSEEFQKDLLEVSYTLYSKDFVARVQHLLQTTSSPAIFIRCAEYLLANKKDVTIIMQIENARYKKFKNNNFIGFDLLRKRITHFMQKKEPKHPPLKDLFSKNFLPGEVVVYSLQRSNRNFPGLVVIRKGDGSFVKNKNGSIFHTSQLARAVTNYPYYITNGNTPQGIFRWTGFDTSSISYIGPTTNLQLVMPYEVDVQKFFSDSITSNQWSKKVYSSLLPSSWKNFDGIYQSYYAGEIGRSEIIMHGTTINPAYYKNQTFYPQTPSLGCLCSYEEWDVNGMLIKSNQQKIADALINLNTIKGYVVVIDIDDKNTAVSEKEIVNLIQVLDRSKPAIFKHHPVSQNKQP